jgi:hypothetical protein
LRILKSHFLAPKALQNLGLLIETAYNSDLQSCRRGEIQIVLYLPNYNQKCVQQAFSELYKLRFDRKTSAASIISCAESLQAYSVPECVLTADRCNSWQKPARIRVSGATNFYQNTQESTLNMASTVWQNMGQNIRILRENTSIGFLSQSSNHHTESSQRAHKIHQRITKIVHNANLFQLGTGTLTQTKLVKSSKPTRKLTHKSITGRNILTTKNIVRYAKESPSSPLLADIFNFFGKNLVAKFWPENQAKPAIFLPATTGKALLH